MCSAEVSPTHAVQLHVKKFAQRDVLIRTLYLSCLQVNVNKVLISQSTSPLLRLPACLQDVLLKAMKVESLFVIKLSGYSN